MEKKTIKDIELTGKKVLIRVDYNVPLDKKTGEITDDTRIRATLPTLNYLLEKNAAVIIASHLGRPHGSPTPELSLVPVAKRLASLLKRDVAFVDDCVGPAAEAQAKQLQAGQILMLENLRFHAEEEKNDPEFSRQLAALAEVLVNDAFGVSHRAHASVAGVTKYMPSVAGFLMEKEIAFLSRAVLQPEHPYAAIMGGVKVSDKIGVIENLLTKVDTLIIGGGMANTFIAAQGFPTGRSIIEADKFDTARAMLAEASKRGVKLLLPDDFVVADKFDAGAQTKTVKATDIPDGWMALDIGPASREKFAAALAGAKLVMWNGPMGVFEMDVFAQGTDHVARAVAASNAVTIVGGGDSIAAIEKAGVASKISHISTGGGASLEFLEGKNLPGIAAIAEKDRSEVYA